MRLIAINHLTASFDIYIYIYIYIRAVCLHTHKCIYLSCNIKYMKYTFIFMHIYIFTHVNISYVCVCISINIHSTHSYILCKQTFILDVINHDESICQHYIYIYWSHFILGVLNYKVLTFKGIIWYNVLIVYIHVFTLYWYFFKYLYVLTSVFFKYLYVLTSYFLYLHL